MSVKGVVLGRPIEVPKKNDFGDILKIMKEIYDNKNSDYGDSVHETYEKYGLVSLLVRMEDKLNRARTLNLKQDRKVVDETIYDTLIDLANYAVIAAMEIKNHGQG